MINNICVNILSMKDSKLLNTLKFSFIKSIPVLIGYVFMGIAFGILLYVAGFDFRYALVMAMLIYSGTLQFAAVSFLSQGTDILSVILISATMNFRYLFYGISSLERYRNTSFYKPFLIHYTVDETFSIISSTSTDESIDRVRFYFFLSLFDHIYWVIGCVLGNVMASVITFTDNYYSDPAYREEKEMSQPVLIILTCIIMTFIFRFLPYLIFPESKETPEILIYLSDKLPIAIVGLLIVYSLKDINTDNFFIPELVSVISVIALHKWKHNTLISIIGGTLLYMFLIQKVF